MKKINKTEWLEAGLDSLVKNGEEGLRIEKLCVLLKVSKGSFYHHFKDLEAYIKELLNYWKDKHTEEVIESVEKEPGIKNKIETLNKSVLKENHLLEVRIRAWGIRNRIVQEAIDKVDDRRINYLKNIYLEKGNSDKTAFDFARIDYASFIGFQQLFRNLPDQEKERLSEIHQKLFKLI